MKIIIVGQIVCMIYRPAGADSTFGKLNYAIDPGSSIVELKYQD